MRLEYRFPNDVVFEIDEEREICWTHFPDGTSVPATANNDAESVERAKELGYHSTWEMTLFHELSHSLLAAAMGLPYSPVLWMVAHPDDPKPPKATLHEEECQVFTIQKALLKAVNAMEAMV